MANEVRYDTFQGLGVRAAYIVSDLLHENLMDPTGLRFLVDWVSWPRKGGSDTTRKATLTRSGALTQRSSEISGGVSNSAVSPSYFAITPTRYYKKYQWTDFFNGIGGVIDPEYIVNSLLVPALDWTITDLLCAAFANIATQKGTPGSDLTLDDMLDAKYALNLALNPFELAAVLHQVQVNHLIESTRSESGPFQFRTDLQLIPSFLRGTGTAGSILDVAVTQSDSVALCNANVDRQGCMFSFGAFAGQLANAADMVGGMQVDPADLILVTDELYVERVRDADNGMTSALVNAFPAISEQEDLRAVRIESAAS